MRLNVPQLSAAVALAAAAACAGGGGAAAPAGAERVDPARTGTITGRVAFDGTVPENPPVTVVSDPACVEAHPDGLAIDSYVVADGGLDNVFVYVKDGLGNYAFDTPAEPVVVDQQGCRYTPRVLGVRVGQPLEIANSDTTMHNVHGVPDANAEFNLSHPAGDFRHTRTFAAPEVMVPLKCDLHPWMTAYVGVVAHPYFAVTQDGGTFELSRVPAGTYTIEAWHEKAGTATQQVTIAANETKAIAFSFGPAARSSN